MTVHLYPVQSVVGHEDEGLVDRHAVDRLELAGGRAAAPELQEAQRVWEG